MFKLMILTLPILLLSSGDISQYLVKNKLNDSFITKYEYGKMLYKNPRGVSCIKCHGIDAKGKIIARFIHMKKKKKYHCVVQSADITDISKEQFIIKLDPNKKSKKRHFEKSQVCEKLIYGHIMPKYFLTDDEIDSLFYYIKHIGQNDG